MKNATICLCMIVKDEIDVLGHCLNSVKPLIDRWLIVDTGSSDGTQELIRTEMTGIRGELHEKPWVNFGFNRSQAIELAGQDCDYLLFIDADEELDRAADFAWPELTADVYLLLKKRGTRAYRIPALARASLNWRFEGVLHEYLESDQPHDREPLDGICINSDRRGARSRDPHTYKRDALLLEAGLIDEPDNKRYVFYLAQSYRDYEDYDLAIRHYERRAEMGGWGEEVYNALYQAAKCRLWRGDSWVDVLEAFLKAHASRPSRAEALYAIADYYANKSEYALALLFLERVNLIDYPAEDILFLEPGVYGYKTQMLIAVCAYYLGDLERASKINQRLLADQSIPTRSRNQIKQNQDFTLNKLNATGQAVQSA